MASIIAAILISGLTYFSYVFTKSVNTVAIRTQVIYVSLFTLLFFVYFTEKMKTTAKEIKVTSLLLTLFVLMLVGSTGWFSSPFSFLLYFLLIFYSFVFSPIVLISFILVLMYIIYVSIDGKYESISRAFFTILSLIGSIPINYYLREKYLKIREFNREILVLKKKDTNFIGQLDHVLENRINYFAAVLRQPISDIKNLTYRLAAVPEPEKKQKISERIVASANDALQVLNQFEEETTGRKIISKENSSVPLPQAGQE